MHQKTRAKFLRSRTSYTTMQLTEESAEAVTFPDKNGNLVVEITPHPSLGIAQVVIMSPEQSGKIAEYTRRQCDILRELGRSDLLLDITYVREGKLEG